MIFLRVEARPVLVLYQQTARGRCDQLLELQLLHLLGRPQLGHRYYALRIYGLGINKLLYKTINIEQWTSTLLFTRLTAYCTSTVLNTVTLYDVL